MPSRSHAIPEESELRRDRPADAGNGSAVRQERPDFDSVLDAAQRAWAAGDTLQAERLALRLLPIYPDAVELLHLLAVMANAKRDIAAACGYLERACAVAQAPAVCHANLAELYRLGGRLGDAEAALRCAVARDPNLFPAWNNLGIVLQERGQLDESRHCLERMVALAPDLAEGWSNLGNTLRQLGNLVLARQHYERALGIDPNAARLHTNYAALLADLGELDTALLHVRRAIEIDPAQADAHVTGAIIEGLRGCHEMALRWIDQALSATPDHVRALLARADSLEKLGRLDEALALCDQVLAQHPDDGHAQLMRGRVLQALGQDAAALSMFEQAEALLPRPGLAMCHGATLLAELGCTAAARATLDHALSLQPDLAEAWYARAELQRFTADAPEIAAMERLLGAGRQQAYGARIQLHFALGKAYLDARLGAPAFRHLTAGNRLKRDLISYDPDTTERWLASIMAQHPAGSSAVSDGASSDLPVFVVGMPRSGTTLVEQILASHPRIHGAGELRHIRWLVDAAASPDDSYPALLARLRPAQSRRLGEAYLARLRELAPDAARIVDKMPSNFLYLGLIRRILPAARIIHCRRDPLDTCFSCYSKLFSGEQNFSYDLDELGRFYCSYHGLMAHWHAVLPAASILTVDYAELVGDLERQAKRLVAFCDLPWDDRCLRFHENTRPVRTASLHQVREPIYRTSVGHAQAYREHLGPLLRRLAPLLDRPGEAVAGF